MSSCSIGSAIRSETIHPSSPAIRFRQRAKTTCIGVIPTANAAIQAIFGHYDQAQRNTDDRVVLEQLAKDLPEIVLYSVSDLYVYNKDLKGFHPNSVTPFDDMMNVDI